MSDPTPGSAGMSNVRADGGRGRADFAFTEDTGATVRQEAPA